MFMPISVQTVIKKNNLCRSGCQSLEFVAEMRILVEMKIENRWEKIFSVGKKSTSILFFYEN